MLIALERKKEKTIKLSQSNQYENNNNNNNSTTGFEMLKYMKILNLIMYIITLLICD